MATTTLYNIKAYCSDVPAQTDCGAETQCLGGLSTDWVDFQEEGDVIVDTVDVVHQSYPECRESLGVIVSVGLIDVDSVYNQVVTLIDSYSST